MAYSTDFKHRELDYIKEGHSHVEAAKVFDVGVRTLFMWEKKDVNKDTHTKLKSKSTI
ncbi:tnpB [Streptococcus pseudopneumoniae]|nr:tnpB [Streptococcus pseudopneumoniae]